MSTSSIVETDSINLIGGGFVAVCFLFFQKQVDRFCANFLREEKSKEKTDHFLGRKNSAIISNNVLSETGNKEGAAPPPLEDSSIPRIVVTGRQAAVGEEEERQISISLNSSSLPWK